MLERIFMEIVLLIFISIPVAIIWLVSTYIFGLEYTIYDAVLEYGFFRFCFWVFDKIGI